MPHEMPSIDRPARTRLRDRPGGGLADDVAELGAEPRAAAAPAGDSRATASGVAVAMRHTSKRSASTGGSWAARRAG